jgi:hypothetical protein
MSRQTNAFNRGSAPDRARDSYQRSGSFEPGHKKLGGRKTGTPNRISASHKKAMREAIHRIGYDGNGKDGEVGYFKWVAGRDLGFFYVDVWLRLLELEEYHAGMGIASAPETMDEAPPRDVLRKKKTRLLGWLRGDDDAYESLVQDYMRMAVEGYPFAKCLSPPSSCRQKTGALESHDAGSILASFALRQSLALRSNATRS